MDGDLESNTKAPPAQAPRSRLLLSCGESILAVAGSAYRRVEASRGPAGCLARAASRVAGPVLRPLRPTCLSALSFADRQLAAALFPRAERALAKVDGFVLLVESMPARFDGAADGLEALVAGLRSGGGVAAGLALAGRAPRDGKGGDGDVFRDIRCDDEETGGAARRDAGKVCEDVSARAGSLDAVTVAVDGAGEDGGAGVEVKTISRVASADKIAGETQSGEEMERSDAGSDHLRPSSDETGHDDEAAYGEAVPAEAEKQEASSGEGEGEEGQMSLDAPGAEQRDVGVRVEQDGRSMDAVTVAADGGGENGAAGDEVKATSRAASAGEIAGETQCDEEMERSDTGSDHIRPSSDETGHDDGAAQAAYRKAAARAEEERQEAGSDEGERGEDLTNFHAPSAGEQHGEGVKDGSSMEAVEANAAEAMEAVKVESQQVASLDAGSTGETGEASGKESSDDGHLLDLFDQAWQHKLA